MSTTSQTQTNDYQALLLSLREVLGVVVDDDSHALIKNKLGPVLSRYEFDTLNDLANAMRVDEAGDLLLDVVQAITEHDAIWFGYPDISRFLQSYLLPGYAKSAKPDIRVWVVGCGQGQMAYSIAMLVEEFRQDHEMDTEFEIFASDMSESVVSQASKGIYDNSKLSGLPVPLKQKYMTVSGGQLKLDETIMSMVRFKVCDLQKTFDGLGHFDLIICPDLLIYYSNSLKSRILDGFSKLLQPSGVLVVGSNEPVTPYTDRFERVNHEAGVFYRQIPNKR